MFPYDQNNRFSPQAIFFYPHQDIIQDNQILGEKSVDSSNLDQEGQIPIILSNSNTNNDVNLACVEKKIIRKEIERQRRQQMSTLHASLRSLLPLESLKGKRSMSDHINEAAKYIKHLRSNVQELSAKRDKLKNLSNSSSYEHGINYESAHDTFMNSIVSVRSYLGGVEIVISCDSGDENFLLSRVLEAVIEEGFDVVSCISTKSDQRIYNTIQCQANHNTYVDLAALQQKLNDVILSTQFISK
ncbi:transcription factor bHLH36 [Ricinus communis]|uniref:DNA binding protein, putative n=1 Tax=Ricinus communis TaxID=3988 RepID=B9R9K3_RICCO|nr:transcription factor bHLH36 [Ricinus communis]EEF51480.1 DNA binding protein, putative [Ricinus communis]